MTSFPLVGAFAGVVREVIKEWRQSDACGAFEPRIYESLKKFWDVRLPAPTHADRTLFRTHSRCLTMPAGSRSLHSGQSLINDGVPVLKWGISTVGSFTGA